MTTAARKSPSRPLPQRNGSGTSDFEAALRQELRGEVAFDSYSRHIFSRDASMYSIEPIGVAFPRDADDVAAAVAVAAEHGAPVLSRGGGTSLAGQTVGAALVLDMSRHMNRIVELDPDRRRARVEPGVVQDDLNKAAGEHGLMFGADTSTSNRATLGGMIGNNSAGSHSVRFGMTVDHVEALDVVLSDASRARLETFSTDELARRAAAQTLEGSLYRELPRIVEEHREGIETGFPKFWRQTGGYRLDRLLRDGGYDMARFVVGSEGTLVAVTEALVDLVAMPKVRVMAVGHFESTQAALAATADAMERGAAAVELLDHAILELAKQKREFRELSTIIEGDPNALVFVTFFADSEEEALSALDGLVAAWKKNGHGYHTLRAVSSADQAAVLLVRKSGLGLLMASSEGSRRPLAFVEDTAVDPAHLSEYVAKFTEVLDRHELKAGYYGHCSVGCLHIRPFVDLTQPTQVETMRSVSEEISALVASFGGVNSSEHGDGLARSEFNRRIFGDDLYEAMREVKRLFDPDGRMNPGKMVDAPPMTDDLRDPALAPPGPITTRLHFDYPGGMRGAADRCMNIGACRKGSTGVMCPSYMATREEEHATRGRANALFKALSEPDPHAALGDERLYEILDLCLECKACKAECPLGVDMASMKSEFLAHYQDIHGVSLRSRMFGQIRRLNRLGAATAPLSNLPSRLGPARLLLDRGAGIAPTRPLPRFARETLVKWKRRRPTPAGPSARGDLIFLADSFTTFTEPGIGRASVELLERAGWRVLLESAGCCGRASISKGLLDQAKEMAADMVSRLAPYAERGVPIVGCEPSCLLTLREEHLALLPGDARAEAVAGQAKLVEELIVEVIDDGSLELDPGAPVSGKRIVFHGHCHQKALAGTASTVALLERIPGAEVVELDAGCCGMAGSFGFESEHYELSMKIGGLRLFPALAEEGPETIVAATGVSCRQQIGHGTGREARHPVELVRAALIEA